MRLLSETAKNTIAGFIKGIVGILGVPIRELHMTIGHSTVSGALLIALAILGSTWMYNVMTFEITAPAWEALKREREARALVYEVQAAESTQRTANRSWTLSAIRAEPELGVYFKFPPLKNAIAIELSWRIDHALTRANGLERFAIPAPVDGQEPPAFQEVLLEKALIGASWISSALISLDAVQIFPDGGRSRLTGRNKSAKLP